MIAAAAMDLEEMIHRGIPLSQAMGYRITELADTRICVAAPLAPNRNVHETGFAGSLYALGILTAWGLCTHVVARAVLTSVVDHGVGFFRTPKRSSARGLLSAWGDAREEFFLLAVLMLGATAVLWREDGDLLDVRLWSALLVLQAIPYAASVLLSIISATPRLSGRLVSARKRALATSSA